MTPLRLIIAIPSTTSSLVLASSLLPSLISDNPSSPHAIIDQGKYEKRRLQRRKLNKFFFVCSSVLLLAILGCLSFVVVPREEQHHHHPQHTTPGPESTTITATNTSKSQTPGLNHPDSRPLMVHYECPKSTPPKSKNDVDASYFDYSATLKVHTTGELTHHRDYYVNGFRNAKHGGHWENYTLFKQKVTEFRAEFFGGHLETGDLLYEGAGAEGFNLLMTVEILHEQRGISNVTVYGHDYVLPHVQIANKLFSVQEKEQHKSWFRKGTYCHADSTNLSFVPPNTFDMVYTYVDPLIDGLGRYDYDVPSDERALALRELCPSNTDKNRTIVREDQGLQEEWHSDWVKELVRIVKPGKWIVIESVCQPLCNATLSMWGGVSEEWWVNASQLYDWGVDANSIAIYQEEYYLDAYNVVMQKLL